MNKKTEKQLLALDIIIGKQVDMRLLFHSDCVETYNNMAYARITLGQFKLLKEITNESHC